MNFDSNLDPQWLEAQYLLWQRDPGSLPADWQAFFRGFEPGGAAAGPTVAADPAHARKQSGVQSLLYRYRDVGHLLACTDPLSPCPQSHPFLELSAFGEQRLVEGSVRGRRSARRLPPLSAAARWDAAG